MYKFALIGLFAFLVSFSTVRADENSIPLVPGQYSVKQTTSSNLSPEPKTETVENCIPTDSFNPAMALPDASCTVSNIKKSGNNKLTFDINCEGNQQMPPMTGKTEAETTKSTLKIKMDIVTSFQGKEFKVKSKSEAKRIGDCKQ